MLIVRATVPDLECTERMSLQAFYEGRATTAHFDDLADCHDIIALTEAPEAGAVTEISLYALQNIQDRFSRTGKMGASGEELQALLALVDFSQDFWSRKSGTVYSVAYKKLQDTRKLQKGAERMQKKNAA